MLDVLDKNDLKAQYKLTDHFIKIHGRAMGRVSGRWSRTVVESYLSNLFEKEQRERRAAEERNQDLREHLQKSIRRAQVRSIVPGEMRGRGGRVAAS